MFNSPTNSFTIFKKGSTTFFFFSLFFPLKKRKEVFDLYAFMRIPDDYIDQMFPDVSKYNNFKSNYLNKKSNIKVINNFLKLEKKYRFDKSWTQAFFRSLDLDLTKKTYKSFQELENYLYGIAEVVGLYMCRILDLPEEALEYGKKQGKAMQMINIIRDINVDKTQMGREYIPHEFLEKFGLKDLSFETIQKNQKNFENLIHFLIDKYLEVQEAAQHGYKFIPRRYLIPIKSAADAYKLTAKKIKANPMLIFKGKVKPNKFEYWKILISNLFYKYA